jgi:hypothetical protein
VQEEKKVFSGQMTLLVVGESFVWCTMDVLQSGACDGAVATSLPSIATALLSYRCFLFIFIKR